MSENLKPRLDPPTPESQQDRLARASNLARESDNASASDTGPVDDAESQMRKALGLLGEGQRHRPDAERSEQPNRVSDRFNGGVHRRRFVQDGDIPVTVLRRDQGHEAPVHRGIAPTSAPTSSRLQRVEAALVAETAAREKAERSLADMQAMARDLQTKIGHADLTKTETIEALRLEREVLAQLRIDIGAQEARLQEALEQIREAEKSANADGDQLRDERNARADVERRLRAAESARDAAERMVRDLSLEVPAIPPVEAPRRRRVEPEVATFAPKRQRSADLPAADPEPVKWWLNTKPAGKRR